MKFTFSECAFLPKFLCVNKREGFRGLSVFAVAFPVFDKGTFFRLFRFFCPIFHTLRRNAEHVFVVTVCNNGVCLGR